MTIVTIDAGAIQDWDDFHSAFSKAFGFPSFYGRNMDAWIDCLTHLDDAESGMTAVTVDPGAVLTLQIDRIDVFADRCPEAYAALIDEVVSDASAKRRRETLIRQIFLSLVQESAGRYSSRRCERGELPSGEDADQVLDHLASPLLAAS